MTEVPMPIEACQAAQEPPITIEEALEAARTVANEFMAQQGSKLTLELVTSASVKSTVKLFVDGARGRKVYWWDWESFFHKRVKGKPKGWMFALHLGKQPVALCIGSVVLKGDHVALEYLERRPYAHNVRGMPLAVAYQFAVALANVLGLNEVRFNQPLNEKLSRFYARRFGMTPFRQMSSDGVSYLFKKVKP